MKRRLEEEEEEDIEYEEEGVLGKWLYKQKKLKAEPQSVSEKRKVEVNCDYYTNYIHVLPLSTSSLNSSEEEEELNTNLLKSGLIPDVVLNILDFVFPQVVVRQNATITNKADEYKSMYKPSIPSVKELFGRFKSDGRVYLVRRFFEMWQDAIHSFRWLLKHNVRIGLKNINMDELNTVNTDLEQFELDRIVIIKKSNEPELSQDDENIILDLLRKSKNVNKFVVQASDEIEDVNVNRFALELVKIPSLTKLSLDTNRRFEGQLQVGGWAIDWNTFNQMLTARTNFKTLKVVINVSAYPSNTPELISKLNKLETLHICIDGCTQEQLDSFLSLTTLKELKVSVVENGKLSFKKMSQLVHLQKLIIEGNEAKINDLAESIVTSKDLKHVKLSGFWSGETVLAIATKTQVEILELRFTNFPDADKILKILELSHYLKKVIVIADEQMNFEEFDAPLWDLFNRANTALDNCHSQLELIIGTTPK
jgi:hypothetical protein